MPNLDEIKARRERINGASWKAVEGNSNDIRSSVFAGNDLLATLSPWKRHEYADFIANAPTDIDWLIGEVERLREERKNYRRTPMTRLTDERLAEIEERCNATTSGLWETDTGGDVSSNNTASQGYKNHTICERPHNPLHPCESKLSQQFMNMEFIAHARQDIPDLLAEVKALKAEIVQAEAERDVLVKELIKECHFRLCEDPERPCPFDEETEGEYCSNECANADPETCWLKYAQQHAEKKGA